MAEELIGVNPHDLVVEDSHDEHDQNDQNEQSEQSEQNEQNDDGKQSRVDWKKVEQRLDTIIELITHQEKPNLDSVRPALSRIGR